MSFEEYKREEGTRQQEMHGANKDMINIPVDGADVGDDTQKKNKETEEKQKDAELTKSRIKTPEEMQAVNRENKEFLTETAEHNPDWPPASGNPEAEHRLAGTMEHQFNSVV